MYVYILIVTFLNDAYCLSIRGSLRLFATILSVGQYLTLEIPCCIWLLCVVSQEEIMNVKGTRCFILIVSIIDLKQDSTFLFFY